MPQPISITVRPKVPAVINKTINKHTKFFKKLKLINASQNTTIPQFSSANVPIEQKHLKATSIIEPVVFRKGEYAIQSVYAIMSPTLGHSSTLEVTNLSECPVTIKRGECIATAENIEI